MGSRRAVLRGVLATLAVGCGTPPTSDAGTDDVMLPPDGEVLYDGTLELGEGQTVFRPIADGDTLLIARGCQGSQHVWISLRASPGLDPRGMIIRLRLQRASDDVDVGLEFLVRLSFTPDTDHSERLGLTLQIPVPDDALTQDLVLSGEVIDRAGHGARAERTVQVAWGTEVCGG